MKISRTEQFRAAAEPAGEVLFLARDGAPERRLPVPGLARPALAVPGDAVAIHWIDLPDGLAPAQAAAAARLRAGELSAQPLAEMHVVAGGREKGLTCVALVPMDRMAAWLEAAAAAGIDPDAIVPAPLLIPPPEEGLVRFDGFGPPVWRGQAEAFALEPELAGAVVGERPVREIDAVEFEAGIAAALAAPAANLRQGPFARRRQWKIAPRTVRRLALLGIALLLVTLAVQVAGVMRYSFSADRLEAEASALRAGGVESGPAPGTSFSALAGLLFDAVQATPNAELSALRFGADGALQASVFGDTPATLAALRQRIEAAGGTVVEGESRSAGGRAAVELTVRAP